jgi:flagellum-specific ATP synthase
VSRPHWETALRVKDVMNRYLEAEDLIRIGAYKRGSSAATDEALDLMPEILSFLKQDLNEKRSLIDVLSQLNHLVSHAS